MPPRTHEADVVVVGAGVAGLTVALGLGDLRVALITKGALGDSGATPLAQGGIAAAVARGDSPALHATDTLIAAAGLAAPEAVSILTSEAPDAIRRIGELGVRLDREPDGSLAVHREAAHGRGRVVHARDATGREVARGLTQALVARDSVTVFERLFATRLILSNGRIGGIATRDGNGRPHIFVTSRVVLATGGIGRVWARTTNPQEATGDGLAMAAHAGALLADLEFVQFHPTALLDAADPLPLLTEALRGAGARLVDEEGTRFLIGVHPAAELAPRDVVSRALARHILAGHRVFLDARSIGEAFPERFPTVYDICRRSGLDPMTHRVPVTPAAHYHMGGVLVDDLGRTSVPGLLACGEVACTGVHGANRLASNSLLEGLVFGHRLASHLVATLPETSISAACTEDVTPVEAILSADDLAPIVAAIRTMMWEKVGLLRDASGLAHARDEIHRARRALPRGCSEAHNLLLVAQLVTTAAERRTESRGAHHRTDHEASDPAWQMRQITTLPKDEPDTNTIDVQGDPR